MRFIKYLTIFILLTVQYSFQESSSENLLPTETLSSADKSLSSEGGSLSEDGLMQSDGENETNSADKSSLENAEETGENMEIVDPNTNGEGDNDEKNNSSESLPFVNSVVPSDEESIKENVSNYDGETDNNEEEETLPVELKSENLDESEVNEVDREPSSDSSNDDEINQESVSYKYEPQIDLGFIVDPENLYVPSQIQTSTEVPETSRAIKKPVSESKKTVYLRTNNHVSKNKFTKGLKSLGNKFGSVFGSVKNKAKNVFKSSSNGFNSLFKSSKSKLKDSPKNLKSRFNFFSGKERSKKLVSKGADKREKRSILTQSAKGLGKDIAKLFKTKSK